MRIFRHNAILLGLIALGVALRLRELYFRPFWGDEIQQLSAVRRSLPDMLQRFIRQEPGGFPGDYLLTWPLAQFTTSKWILAVPHLFCMLLSFYLLYQVCLSEKMRVFGMYLAFFLFAINRNLIFHALEFRPYAVLPAMALFISLSVFRWMQRTSWDLRDAWYWGCLVFVSLLFHFYGGLMLSLYFLYHLLFNRRQATLRSAVAPFWKSTLVAGLFAFPFWLYYVMPSAGMRYGFRTFEYSTSTFFGILRFVIGNLADTPIPKFTAAQSLLLVIVLWLPDTERMKRWAFLSLLIFLPILLIFIADYRAQYYFVQRQFVWLMPFWAVLLGKCLDAVIKNRFHEDQSS